MKNQAMQIVARTEEDARARIAECIDAHIRYEGYVIADDNTSIRRMLDIELGKLVPRLRRSSVAQRKANEFIAPYHTLADGTRHENPDWTNALYEIRVYSNKDISSQFQVEVEKRPDNWFAARATWDKAIFRDPKLEFSYCLDRLNAQK